MAKKHYHGGCKLSETGISVGENDFLHMLASEKCHLCESKMQGPKLRYRVTNSTGETLGRISAHNEFAAYGLAAAKFGALGIKVQQA